MRLVSGREKELQHDKEQAQAVYKHVQGEVERGLEYLLVYILSTDISLLSDFQLTIIARFCVYCNNYVIKCDLPNSVTLKKRLI